MAARTIASTDTLETFRTEFNALSENDFGDIGALNPSISATSVIGAVNELYSSIAGSLSFDITDGSTTQSVSNTQTITFASTANQINAVVSATDTVTFSLPSDVTITGEFTAQGTGIHSLGTIQVSGNTISSSDTSLITVNDSLTVNGTLTVSTINSSSGNITSNANIQTSGYFYTQSTNGIVFEGTTNDNFETDLVAQDPTADRTITIPNETGTIVTTGSSGVVTGTMIGTDTVGEANMANDAIGQDQLKNVVTLQILNSSGVVVKTIYGAGA
jgi:phage baseplate assembly protein gpV